AYSQHSTCFRGLHRDMAAGHDYVGLCFLSDLARQHHLSFAMTETTPGRHVVNPVAIAFHAEKLHDDPTWRRVERIARWMKQQDMKATFFVYPFRAQVAGKDITDRVQAVAALGHEIGQHTHFYAGTRIEGREKADDLSDQNIVHCLNRDFETLERMGFVPKAFTAGAWFVTQAVRDTLVSLGFAYD